MAHALRFYATVSGKTLPLPDLARFEGKRVHVTVVVDEAEEAGVLAHQAAPRRDRQFGTLAGQIVIADDFDAPLPEDLQRAFDGTSGA